MNDKEYCEWEYKYSWGAWGEDDSYWRTSCSKEFRFYEKKFDKKCKFCCFCGKQIVKKEKKKERG